MRCKVAVLPAVGELYVIEEVELAGLKPNEARVKMKTCGICHSDLHSQMGEHGHFDGSATGGHEATGVVTEVGSEVTYVKPGDRVICCLIKAGCGHCFECLMGRPYMCVNNGPQQFKVPGPYTRDNGDVPIQLPGAFTGFAEYANVSENNLVKLDDDIPHEVGSIISCAVISGFIGLLHRACVKPFESLVVIGCGGVGVSAIQGGRFVGAFPIVGVDIDDGKLERAKGFGLDYTVNPKTCDAVATVRELCDGRGADHAMVCVAGPGIKRQALDMLHLTGRLTCIGHGTYEAEMLTEFSAMDFFSGRTLTGSGMGATNIRLDIPRLMALYRMGHLKVDEMIDGRYRLEQINEANESAVHGGVLKNILVFD
ncbi:MAG: alcohol dehydrogenase catalytic domain-containing protein [Thermoleophilia bacterium]|nr:alcohol dehydrogenase catalytic domain-containing protein [Thermoleophilia bacterium]